MADPWLTLIGMPDDTAAQLPPASRAVIDAAEVIFGGPRHLELVSAGERGQPWPVPFSVEPVLEAKGKRVAVLASGDPFWFGVGGSLAAHLDPADWVVLPAPSTFCLVAGALGWRMEEVTCHGLHAAPFALLRRALSPLGKMICLVRDGAAPAALADWLTAQGAGAASLTVCENMGGPRQRIRNTTAASFDLTEVAAPVAVAVMLPGDVGLSRASGLPDTAFAHDGQITKRPIRALTLSALAPRQGETLWDIGAGSGSVSVEWCLAGGHATAFEIRADRVVNIRRNIDAFGIGQRMQVVEGASIETLRNRPVPDAVFVGGGGTAVLFEQLIQLPAGTRLVANGVTLETETLLLNLHARHGGNLMRFEIAQAQPLGALRGWTPSRPLVQWSVTL
ncbi:precorrin-6y C5,15-methyltransferase (decarboxylating) subunit CbiE [Sulfitobacter sp. F26204]|uniref:precorrin-6y C5,15-methyltransferase (decarboxylating) subunit CbiE n=1 Tax=Sulfitobacter sp. F26204 TaxID=2996014 RepID=UPI00225DF82E|nr:precorrin-6y C5,15-methyltransferase (decarboxylating) subunit CbiE [Sulfitobacter sp. F26204]MCX7558106.1 precorrin-6y C5,15-methyltransferase (decarboxylating) subunit CbiE [Sulfitobacter sp. F26204]